MYVCTCVCPWNYSYTDTESVGQRAAERENKQIRRWSACSLASKLPSNNAKITFNNNDSIEADEAEKRICLQNSLGNLKFKF